MIIQQDLSDAVYQIHRYEPGKIWINQRLYQESIIIRPTALLFPWPPKKLSDLTFHHFNTLQQNPPHILLLGTGLHLAIPAEALILPWLEKEIGVEFMDSRAACFTYNILASEGRNVAACILNCDS
jgi:uncharacterized protein